MLHLSQFSRVRKSVLVLLIFLGTVSLVMLSGFEAQAARDGKCAALFEQRKPNFLRVRQVQTQDQVADTAFLTPQRTQKLFGGHVDKYASISRSIALMGNLPLNMDATAKATVWIALSRGIADYKKPDFVSRMYVMDGPRYLFRGSAGEALFIDVDSTVYRLSMQIIEDGEMWGLDYSIMHQLKPSLLNRLFPARRR